MRKTDDALGTVDETYDTPKLEKQLGTQKTDELCISLLGDGLMVPTVVWDGLERLWRHGCDSKRRLPFWMRACRHMTLISDGIGISHVSFPVYHCVYFSSAACMACSAMSHGDARPVPATSSTLVSWLVGWLAR